MMRRLWLVFAQTITVGLGILFIVTTLRPDWFGNTPPSQRAEPVQGGVSYARAVARATPSVVNVYTRKQVDSSSLAVPIDPELERWFRDVPGFDRPYSATSLGSGVVLNAEGYVITNFYVV